MTPGGATTLATASGANVGFRLSVPLIAGIAVGLASMAAAAAAGLAGFLAAFPSLQIIMKLGGSAYLAWLAWRIGRSGAPQSQTDFTQPISFIGGVWLLWYNPKGWAMTTSAAASFTTLASGPGQLAAVLGMAFGFAAVFSLSIWCIAGQMLARLLKHDWQWRVLNTVLSLLLVASIISLWLE